MWYSRADLPVFTKKGEILNDSTFIINEVYEYDGKILSKENKLYHFYKYSPKPDSTNKYIK